jgi:hypothetical protein
MRWLAAVMLVACGTDEAGDDTGQPVGLVEVFDVDCSSTPGADGKVRVAELLGGPVAIAQIETCTESQGCIRNGGDYGSGPEIHSDPDGSVWFDEANCELYGITRIFVIR